MNQTPFMLVSEVKKDPMFQIISRFFLNFPKKISYCEINQSLIKVLALIKNKSIKTKQQLDFATAQIERDIDDYFIKSSYSSVVHKDECDFMRCIMELIFENQKEELTKESLLKAIAYYLK